MCDVNYTQHVLIQCSIQCAALVEAVAFINSRILVQNNFDNYAHGKCVADCDRFMLDCLAYNTVAFLFYLIFTTIFYSKLMVCGVFVGKLSTLNCFRFTK